jgi:hypothetical protein
MPNLPQKQPIHYTASGGFMVCLQQFLQTGRGRLLLLYFRMFRYSCTVLDFAYTLMTLQCFYQHSENNNRFLLLRELQVSQFRIPFGTRMQVFSFLYCMCGFRYTSSPCKGSYQIFNIPHETGIPTPLSELVEYDRNECTSSCSY